VAARTFTVDEANAALVEVRPLVERMVEHRRSLAAATARWNELVTTIGGNGGGFPPSELEQLRGDVNRAHAEVARCVNAIHGLGAEVKDVDTGLIDFPALRRGEPVLLCWQLGEEDVAWWHGLEDGFAGRRPLPFD
jgi:hypothetical protein